jgi:hypothetical protein
MPEFSPHGNASSKRMSLVPDLLAADWLAPVLVLLLHAASATLAVTAAIRHALIRI